VNQDTLSDLLRRQVRIVDPQVPLWIGKVIVTVELMALIRIQKMPSRAPEIALGFLFRES
jgi:hypothetical protein